MSVLIDSSITIYEALQNIKDGKYVRLSSATRHLSRMMLDWNLSILKSSMKKEKPC